MGLPKRMGSKGLQDPKRMGSRGPINPKQMKIKGEGGQKNTTHDLIFLGGGGQQIMGFLGGISCCKACFGLDCRCCLCALHRILPLFFLALRGVGRLSCMRSQHCSRPLTEPISAACCTTRPEGQWLGAHDKALTSTLDI